MLGCAWLRGRKQGEKARRSGPRGRIARRRDRVYPLAGVAGAKTCTLALMRPISLALALAFALALALPLLGCAADDGFRARLAQGCRSERECAGLAAQADARAATCPTSAGPNTVVRVRLDIGSSAPPCDEVEEDRRVAHGYLDAVTRERARRGAGVAKQKAARRGEERARRDAERAQRRAADEAERREREEREEEDRAERAGRAKDAQDRAERAAREEATREAAAASATRSTPVAPATPEAPAAPAPRDTGGHVCCCDGTVSPTCTTVHRGCCSHHQGVCACD